MLTSILILQLDEIPHLSRRSTGTGKYRYQLWLWICIRIGPGFNVFVDPDLDSESGSESRGNKIKKFSFVIFITKSSVSDPYQDTHSMAAWIRIRILNADPDLHPGCLKKLK
jgi:hypothetical protein